MSEIYKEFTLTWIVNNFSFFQLENDSIYSEEFTPENIEDTPFHINFFVTNIVDSSSAGHASLAVHRGYKSGKDVTLDLEMELCNSKNEVLCITEKKKGLTFKERGKHCFPDVLLMTELLKKIKDAPKDTLVLKCRMGAISESAAIENPTKGSHSIKTTQLLDKLSYTTDVYYSEDPNWSKVRKFPIEENVHLKVDIETHRDDILFKISPNEKYFLRKIKCQITLLEGEEIEISKCDFFSFSEKYKTWHFPSFLKKSLLKKNVGVFYLKFDFTIPNDILMNEHVDESEQDLSSSSFVFKNVPATKFLTDDLRKMLFSTEHADVSFRIDGELISAHKFILSSRSPVFSAMFQQKMVENQTNVIDISDMELQTLKLFLEFLYTGDFLESDWNIMLKILLTAEKYQVPTLKEKCFTFLKLHLTPDNVCDAFSVADMVGEQALKNAIMDYIRENAVEVLSSSKWAIFIEKNIKLSSEIMKLLSENLKSEYMKS